MHFSFAVHHLCSTNSRTSLKSLGGGGNTHCPNFVHDCPNHDLVAFHGDAKISQIKSKAFFLWSTPDFVVKNEAETIGFLLMKTKKRGLHIKLV